MKKLLLALASAATLSLIAVAVLFLLAMPGMQKEIRDRFEGKRWSLPAIVYARPLELYTGQAISAQALEDELALSGYRKEQQPQGEGSYTRSANAIDLISRSFYFPSGPEPALRLRVTFSGNSISGLTDTAKNEALAVARLDPARIGSFHPIAHEDRVVLQSEEVPPILIDSLLAIEDQHFYSHHGISPLAILRAMLANIRATGTVQGGSTITQQLVKNLFLTNERSLRRKIKEAAMAIILDRTYSKQEILTTYINEVFLGQEGSRSIHGFALASQHYFHRSLPDLTVAQIATLVGMVKGPSLYHPERNPENCKQRRRIVLQQMAEAGIIDQTTATTADGQPLVAVGIPKGGFNRFPAFLDLVREQLAKEYQETDLKTNGLQILTTLDPRVQFQVESNLLESITSLEKQYKREKIEGATIVTNRDNGEVLGLAGGKTPLHNAFNRALQARRPIGSLIKPAVYLTALNQGYTLTSPLDDSALTLTGTDGKAWQPHNYDRLEHGQVPLYRALANSYNLATVRLGMTLGLESVIDTIKQLGCPVEIQPLPSLLLGAIDLSPFEVAQIYQTFAADGFATPLRAITAVMAADHSTLSRYGLSVEQRFPPETIFLLNHALQRVISEGTAQSLRNSALRDHAPAGKTGTTNDLRDSWFAGFTGDHLAVVWLGRDDNSPIGLTGASGALAVWTKTLAALHTAPLVLTEPPGIGWSRIDIAGLQPTTNSIGSTLLPFTSASLPQPAGGSGEEAGQNAPPSSRKSLLDTIKNLLN